MKNYSLKSECICCNSQKLTKIYDFGNVPLAGNYVKHINRASLLKLTNEGIS